MSWLLFLMGFGTEEMLDPIWRSCVMSLVFCFMVTATFSFQKWMNCPDLQPHLLTNNLSVYKWFKICSVKHHTAETPCSFSCSFVSFYFKKRSIYNVYVMFVYITCIQHVQLFGIWVRSEFWGHFFLNTHLHWYFSKKLCWPQPSAPSIGQQINHMIAKLKIY